MLFAAIIRQNSRGLPHSRACSAAQAVTMRLGHVQLRTSLSQARGSIRSCCIRLQRPTHSRMPEAKSKKIQTQCAAVACRIAAHAAKRSVVAAAATPAPLIAAEQVQPQQQQQQDQDKQTQANQDNLSILEQLLVWLVQNGVTGIGLDDSKVELYEAADGDRGIMAVEDIPAGEPLICVPLKLAITDVMDEEQRKNIVGEGVLWQDRLVAKLLQQVQAGQESPWFPYVQALPKYVPSALDTFTGSEAEAVQLPAAVAAIQGYDAKVSASWQSCRPDSISGADLRAYRWAHTVVMSRTFGNASQNGGIGVRMLVPLIDMLNHAADETVSGLHCDTPVARDNVRWDVVSPDNSPNKCWEMVLSTTQHIPAESTLQLSYFEGANDEFLLHYGFVPLSNPHDTAQLFSSVTAALEHLWQLELAQGKSAARLSPIYAQALDAGLQALQEEVAAAAADACDADWGPLLDALEPVKVASGSRVSGSLIAALEVMHLGDMAAVEAAVSGLAWQQLQALPTHLLSDLALLLADAQQQGDGQAARLYGGMLRYYSEAMLPEYAPEFHAQVSKAAASTSSSSSNSSSSSDATAVAALQARQKKKKLVPGPPPAAAAVAAVAAAAAQTSDQQGTVVTLELVRQLPLGSLLQALLPDSASSGSSSSSSNICNTTSECLSYALRTAVRFRVSKKMLLADVVIAAKVPYAVLEQQQQLQQKAAAAANGSQLECHALPWQIANEGCSQ